MNTLYNMIKEEILKTKNNDYILTRFEYMPKGKLLVEHSYNPLLAEQWRKEHYIRVSSILQSEDPEKKLKQSLSLFGTKVILGGKECQ